jgi:predicted permease
MTGWLIRIVWALYPPRLCFAREIDRDLRALPRSGRSGAFQLWDASITLVRSWWLEARRATTWTSPGSDLKLAVRAVRRAPGYSLAVVSILALALGGNTAVFSVAHAVLLQGLPYGDPERVVSITPTPLTLRIDDWIVDPEFAALEQVETAALVLDGGGANLARDSGALRVSLAQVTEEFFRVLGVDALLGTDRLARGDRSVVLSHAFWVQSFGADASVVGAELELNGRTYRVAGVMPAGVAYPSPVDLWASFPTEFDFYSSAIGPDGLARLAAADDVEAVRRVVEERVAARYAEADADPPPIRITGLRDELTGELRAPLLLLLAIAGLLVLLGCLNLAGVVLSRNAARAAELGLRRALGAGRMRLFGQLLIEVSVLAVLGGSAGIAAASAAAGLLRRMLPAGTPGLDGAPLNLQVVAFAIAATALATLSVGILPALQGAWVGERPRATHGATDDRRSKRLQAGLVVAQVALAFVLVAGASLLGRSLRNLQAVPLGYDLERVLSFQVRLPDGAYDDIDARSAYLRDMQRGLAAVAGVEEVGATTYLPQQGAMGIGLRARRPDAPEGDDTFVTWVQVDRDYFRAMGIPVLQGAPFADPGDHATGFDRVVINRTLAERLFPGAGEVAGRTLRLQSRNSIEARIEAVVGDVHLRDQRSSPTSVVYTDIELAPSQFLGFSVRAQGNPGGLADAVRSVGAAVDPGVAPFNIMTTAQSAARQIAVDSAVARLSLVFSISALVLAALGLYGLVSQGIVRRRRELGIRLALGARPAELLRQAMSRPLLLTVAGLLGGLGIALATVPWVEPLLFRVAPRDPQLLGAVVGAVIGVAALASFVSGRAVLRVQPAESLRAE